MRIIKEWHGRGGSILARFYSCTTDGVTTYWIDYNMCCSTAQVNVVGGANNTVLLTQNAVTLLRLADVPVRYITWINKYFNGEE